MILACGLLLAAPAQAGSMVEGGAFGEFEATFNMVYRASGSVGYAPSVGFTGWLDRVGLKGKYTTNGVVVADTLQQSIGAEVKVRVWSGNIPFITDDDAMIHVLAVGGSSTALGTTDWSFDGNQNDVGIETRLDFDAAKVGGNNGVSTVIRLTYMTQQQPGSAPTLKHLNFGLGLAFELR